jgi:dihydrofolate synthase/folylpolyglutamate synthase
VTPSGPDVRAHLAALEQIGIKLGLDQISALVAALGHPDHAFPSLIVAGTNGKGSVTAMVERGLRAAGYRTGRYTSPHLVDLEERFAIDGRSIDAADLDAVGADVLAVGRSLPAPPTFFEATTAIALETFRRARVDVAVLEVGLGGRLDATNVVTPIGAAITAIDLDHEAMLGRTIEAIAAEKAGVIKPGMFVVLGRNSSAAAEVVRNVCARQRARLVDVSALTVERERFEGGQVVMDVATPSRTYRELRLGLRGRHQADNALVAIALLEELDSSQQFLIDADAIRDAVTDVVWPARLEHAHIDGADVIIDGAHNPAGARALAEYLAETIGRPLPLVIAAMRDKNVVGMLSALAPVASRFVFTPLASERSASPTDLAATAFAQTPSVPVEIATDPRDAIARAASRGTPVVIAGSLYLAGEVRRWVS